MYKKMNQDDFEAFLNNADAIIDAGSTLSEYSVVAWKDNMPHLCSLLCLKGKSEKATVETITEEKAEKVTVW